METSPSYIMGQEAADIVYCDADLSARHTLAYPNDPLPDLDSLVNHLAPDESDEWLAGYNSRMIELLIDPVDPTDD